MKHYLVIGLGRFGSSVAQTLYQHGKHVLAVDADEDCVQELINNEIVENAVTLDATDVRSLKDIGAEDFDTAFVCIGTSTENSILVTLALKEIGVKRVVAKALTDTQAKVLEKVGADEIVFPEAYMGRRTALKEINPNLFEYLHLSDQYLLTEFPAPLSFLGQPLSELKLRRKYHLNVIAIRPASGPLNANPGPDTVLENGDILIVFTDMQSARNLESLS